MAKPLGRQELLARVQALLRRSRAAVAGVTESYADSYLEIDYRQRRIAVGGRDVQLTPLEFRPLAAFVQHPNEVLSRNQLLELVWHDSSGVAGDQVKLYVGYLRRKLEPRARARTDRDGTRLRLPLPARLDARSSTRSVVRRPSSLRTDAAPWASTIAFEM